MAGAPAPWPSHRASSPLQVSTHTHGLLSLLTHGSVHFRRQHTFIFFLIPEKVTSAMRGLSLLASLSLVVVLCLWVEDDGWSMCVRTCMCVFEGLENWLARNPSVPTQGGPPYLILGVPKGNKALSHGAPSNTAMGSIQHRHGIHAHEVTKQLYAQHHTQCNYT